MATYVSVTWTTGDVITETKLDNMVANDQSETAHSSNGLILNNNVPYKAKNAAGTAKDVLKLGTDDILRLSQIRYQSDTTNSIQENVLIQTGWGWIIGDGTTYISETVTFPTAFTTLLAILGTPTGFKSGSNPTSIIDISVGNLTAAFAATNQTVSSFQVGLWTTGTFSATGRYIYSWMALGIKA